ncbi:MAG: type II secretion system F family protein [Patescibacteria group bacterium]|nr:type II secretion system F family protein [Patescibacteria group bacterium]
MAKFHYIASGSGGQIIEGDVEAGSSAAVLGWMSQQGLHPISIKSTEKKKLFSKQLGETITIEDKVFITKYLALMLRVGTDLFRAIDILVADFEKQSVKNLLLEVRESLSKGQPLHTAFANHPKYFSPVFVSLLRAGETSGSLDTVFERLSVDLEKEKELRSRIKGALIYPVILVGLSLGVLFLMMTFVLPRIAETFLSGGMEPPTFSRIVFGVGLFLKEYMLLVVPLSIGLGIGLWFFFRKTQAGKKIGRRIVRRLPVVSDIVQKISIQRFSATLSSLMKSGTPILDAIEITADSVGSDELKEVLMRVSREGIAKGLTVGEAFRKETYFPKVLVNLIAVSENAGHMEEVLETLADFYEKEIDSSLKILVSFLEPVMLMVIGLIVGTIALAIIVPVYQLVGQI